MARLVSRDPFARTELHSTREYDLPSNRGCTWCGRMLHTPKGRPYLYRYETESDDGRSYGKGGPFCSVSCARTYES